MHRFGASLLMTSLAACSTESAAALYTLNLDQYESSDPPKPLHTSHETLLLPLADVEPVQDLSREAPGDLVLAYTRIGCTVGDPNPHLRRQDIALPLGPDVRLRSIAVDEIGGSNGVSHGFSDSWRAGPCFAVRAEGVWSAQTPPSSVVDGDGKRTSRLLLEDGWANAVAIFFQSSAEVTGIRYEIAQ